MEIKLSQITDIGGTEACVDIEGKTIAIPMNAQFV